MRHYIEYKINSDIKNETPEIRIDILYEDDFSNDHYIIESQADESSDSKNIPFIISGNGNPIGKINMTERDTTGFFETILADIKDADFKNEFYSKVFKPLSEDISQFIKRYENLVIDNELTVEGETKRMRVLSGII